MGSSSRGYASIAALCSGCLALVLGCWFILSNAVDRAVRRDAEATALAWARHIAGTLPDIREIAAGRPPRSESLALLQQAARIGNVFRFKLFDASGRLRFVSDELGRDLGNEPLLTLHNPAAAAVVATGLPHTEVFRGTPPRRPRLYAETYLPLALFDGTVGIVEVYIDQTAQEALLHEQFAWTGIAIALVSGLAFGVPGIAFHIRSMQKQRADARLRFLAEHDGLSGLLNRTGFMPEVEAALAHCAPGRSVGLHLVDLDRFKEVNDTLGHDAGDELIRIVASRLRSGVPASCRVARLGGDEFAVLQPAIADEAEMAGLAALLVEALAAPVAVLGHAISPSASIGAAEAKDPSTSAATLLKNADLALYAAKSAGRNVHRIFTADLDAQRRERLRIEALLRRAASEGTFELHFQPIVASGSAALAGFEALLRMRDEDGAMVPPGAFVPVAEEIGLIGAIGAKVLERACLAAAAWPVHLVLSVNLSPRQFGRGDLPEVVGHALAASGLSPARLELEITEGLLLADSDSVLDQLTTLKALGVRIAMDDFGTGYSSLSYLWRFPFDKIKIDRSFVSAFDGGSEAANVLRTIVSLGHALKMEVTAEGVETGEQAAFLKEVACDYAQGFLFGHPLPLDEVAATLIADGLARLDVAGPRTGPPMSLAAAG